MKTHLCLILSAAILMSAAGCSQPSSTGAVQQEVANARQEAAKDNAQATQEAAKVDASANADVAKVAEKADDKKAETSYDVAVTEAEGRHKIDTEKCNAMTGDAQKACKEQADGALKLARANALAAKAAKQS